LAVFIYYIWPKKINTTKKRVEVPLFFCIAGITIGFYNGFFGPGTGSIWTIVITSMLALPIYKATMMTKPLNLMGNLTALLWFILGGSVAFMLAFVMGIGSFIGGWIGAKFVHVKNSNLIKTIFITMMSIAIIVSFVKHYG
jgi:uncharacterized membrane protein YfcA